MLHFTRHIPRHVKLLAAILVCMLFTRPPIIHSFALSVQQQSVTRFIYNDYV